MSDVDRITRLKIELDDWCPVIDDGVGGLQEEEGWRAVRIASHLAGTGRAVAPDTDDAPDRKAGFGADDADRGRLAG